MIDETVHDMVIDSAERLFASFGDVRDRHDSHWRAIIDAGLPLILVSEPSGGLALGGATGAAVIRHAAAVDVRLPIGEAMIARLLLDRAGQDGEASLTTVAWDEARVPWGTEADAVLVEREGRLAVAPAPSGEGSATLSGEPRTALGDGDVRILCPLPGGTGALLRCGAALRTIQMAGAAAAVLDLTVAHVTTREQFGRPLARFQAIQQEVARLGTQVAVLDGCAGIAADFLDGDLGPSLALAAAKARAGEAAGVVAGIAHQAHGAIGFTDEYRLGHLTKSLWAWRSEAGGSAYWQDDIGRAAMRAGGDHLWALVTAA